MQRKSVPRQRSPGFEHSPAAHTRLRRRPLRRGSLIGPAGISAASTHLSSGTSRVPRDSRPHAGLHLPQNQVVSGIPDTSRCLGRRRRSAIRSSHRHKRWISGRPAASRIRLATRYPVAETTRPPAVRGGPGDTNGSGLYQPEIGAEALFPGAPVPGRARFSCPVLAAATEKPRHPVPARPRRTGRAVYRNSHPGFTAAGRAPGRNAAFQKPRNPLGHCMPPCRGSGNSTPGMPRKA